MVGMKGFGRWLNIAKYPAQASHFRLQMAVLACG
jgi:hypothetical protein